MIDYHYGHLAHDSRAHAVSLLDALAFERAVDAGVDAAAKVCNACFRNGFPASSEPIARHGGRSVDVEAANRRRYSKQKQVICREIAKPSDGLEPSTPSLPSRRQAVATHGNGFGLSEPFSAPSHLPPVAPGCDRSAP